MSRSIKPRPLASSHVHDRSYLGEESARPLIDWLNSHRMKADLIEKLLELIKTADRSDSTSEFSETCKKIERVRRELPMKFKPKFVFAGRWIFEWESISHDLYERMRSSALVTVFELAAQGLASRVRKCGKPGCNRWFWAKFEHQKFHSKLCQEQHYHANPTWKARRAQRMRELRQQERERELRQIHKGRK